YKFGPLFVEDGRILAITDLDAPNFRIVEVRPIPDQEPEFRNVVPGTSAVIQNWAVSDGKIFVSYFRNLKTEIVMFDLEGNPIGHLPVDIDSTVRLLEGFDDMGELLFEQESFTEPARICRYSPKNGRIDLWAKRTVPFDSREFGHRKIRFPAKDGISIPMYLVGRRHVIEAGSHPTIMTSYGGYGIPMTPQFSVFVSYLMERGCMFALPNIRGGSEFGVAWHEAAKRRNRQVAFDDFISAAEWLIESGHTGPDKLAIFGGSNSGLLVGVAMTQRPDLFRAVLCMVPMLDMLRYHTFDGALAWKGEFGTAESKDDFTALVRYSPYHNVRNGKAYPATMIVSGDSDQNCNSLHARKMTARLQAASASDSSVVLDYSHYRGHSPVLPLSERVEALTDRMAFLCDQLGLTVSQEALFP
ncbi:MAG: prolyl oligopeptidase family serine peptidase, partial [Candidatus Sulfotelmatobacter sp.]